MPDQATEVVYALLDAWNARDLPRFLLLLTEDVEWHDLGMPDTWPGAARPCAVSAKQSSVPFRTSGTPSSRRSAWRRTVPVAQRSGGSLPRTRAPSSLRASPQRVAARASRAWTYSTYAGHRSVGSALSSTRSRPRASCSAFACDRAPVVSASAAPSVLSAWWPPSSVAALRRPPARHVAHSRKPEKPRPNFIWFVFKRERAGRPEKLDTPC